MVPTTALGVYTWAGGVNWKRGKAKLRAENVGWENSDADT